MIAWLLYKGVKMAAPQVVHVVTPIDLPVTPPKAPPKPEVMGGGGGSKGPTPVVKGHLPKFDEHPIVPPTPPPPQQPKIAIEPIDQCAEGPEDGGQQHAEYRRAELAPGRRVLGRRWKRGRWPGTG